jgi:histone deacetylase 1/2
MNSAQSDQWIMTEEEELNSLFKAGTWIVVDRSKRLVVDSKWVYKIKQQADGLVERYKARLVARGFTQRSGYDFDEIFSLVVRYESLRLLFALFAQREWKSQQYDIKTTFLYDDLTEEIYMKLSSEHRQVNKIARLQKYIYDLK